MRYYIEVAFYTDEDFGFDTDSNWCKNYGIDDANFCIDKDGEGFDYRLKAIVESDVEWLCKHQVRDFLSKVLCNVRFGSNHISVMRNMYDMFDEAISNINNGTFFNDLSGNYEGTYIFYQHEDFWHEDYSATIHKNVCECCGQEIPSIGQKYSVFCW